MGDRQADYKDSGVGRGEGEGVDARYLYSRLVKVKSYREEDVWGNITNIVQKMQLRMREF
jgi:hypothetical protein